MQIFFTKKPDSIRHNRRKGGTKEPTSDVGEKKKMAGNYIALKLPRKKKRRGGGTMDIEEYGSTMDEKKPACSVGADRKEERGNYRRYMVNKRGGNYRRCYLTS